jgi:hypothetical protein
MLCAQESDRESGEAAIDELLDGTFSGDEAE